MYATLHQYRGEKNRPCGNLHRRGRNQVPFRQIYSLIYNFVGCDFQSDIRMEKQSFSNDIYC